MEILSKIRSSLPKRLRPNQESQRSKKPIPFEVIDYELYEPEALCTSFRVPDKKLEAWLFAMLKCQELICEDVNYTTSLLDDQKKTVDPENTITAVKTVQIKCYQKSKDKKLCVLHFYLTTGLVEIQGIGYKHWCEKFFPLHLELVEAYTEQIELKKEWDDILDWQSKLVCSDKQDITHISTHTGNNDSLTHTGNNDSDFHTVINSVAEIDSPQETELKQPVATSTPRNSSADRTPNRIALLNKARKVVSQKDSAINMVDSNMADLQNRISTLEQNQTTILGIVQTISANVTTLLQQASSLTTIEQSLTLHKT